MGYKHDILEEAAGYLRHWQQLPRTRAELAVIEAAIQSIEDVDSDPTALYTDGRHMAGERMLTITPGGRAAVQLAEAIVLEVNQY